MRLTLLILTTLTFSCAQQKDNTDHEITPESMNVFLDNFNWRNGAEFTQVKNNDAIALRLERVDSLKFKYRIELIRQWKHSTFDTGTVIFNQLAADTGVFLKGQRPDCSLQIFISNDSSQYNLFALVSRRCDDTTKNIDHEDFPRIRFKGGF